MHPAAYWKTAGDRIQCELCPHACLIAGGRTGRCGIRRNRDGQLVSESYGLISSLALDPIEKKPLFHVKPGSKVLSLGSAGCNFRCPFCQNWTISQQIPAMEELSPAELLEQTRRSRAAGVAYTYNEPLINFEYVLDCAKLIRRAGLLNILVTNGYVNPAPRAELLPWIDALNIDLKSIRPEYYQKLCGAKLEPVLDTIREAAKVCHVELTHLIVTGANDVEADLRGLVDWVASVSPEIPLHFSRYFPQYQWDEPPTSVELLQKALDIGRRKLKWVYVGNLPGKDDSTRCPDCGTELIPRQGYWIGTVKLKDGHCPQCGRLVPGIF